MPEKPAKVEVVIEEKRAEPAGEPKDGQAEAKEDDETKEKKEGAPEEK